MGGRSTDRLVVVDVVGRLKAGCRSQLSEGGREMSSSRGKEDEEVEKVEEIGDP